MSKSRIQTLVEEKWARMNKAQTLPEIVEAKVPYLTVRELELARNDLDRVLRSSFDSQADKELARGVQANIDCRIRAIQARIASAPEFTPGTRVKVAEDLMEFIGNAGVACPPINTAGKVVALSEYDQKDLEPGKVAVSFLQTALGFEADPCERGRRVTLYIYAFRLKKA